MSPASGRRRPELWRIRRLLSGPTSPVRGRRRPALVSGPRSSHGLVAGQRSSLARTLAESGVSGPSPQLLPACAVHPCCITLRIELWCLPFRVLQPTAKPFGARRGALALAGPSTGPAQPTHPPNAIPAAKLEVSRYLAPRAIGPGPSCGRGGGGGSGGSHGAISCGPRGVVACGPRSAFPCGPCGVVACSPHDANACGVHDSNACGGVRCSPHDANACGLNASEEIPKRC